MTSYLVDTNISSELTRDEADARVLRFLRSTDPERLFLSVLTIGEICKDRKATSQSQADGASTVVE